MQFKAKINRTNGSVKIMHLQLMMTHKYENYHSLVTEWGGQLLEYVYALIHRKLCLVEQQQL